MATRARALSPRAPRFLRREASNRLRALDSPATSQRKTRAALNTPLELQVQSKRRHNHRSAIPVVARVVDVLHAQRREKPSPDMQRVIALDNVFPAVVQSAIAQQKT